MSPCVPHVVMGGLLPSTVRLEIPKLAILTHHPFGGHDLIKMLYESQKISVYKLSSLPSVL